MSDVPRNRYVLFAAIAACGFAVDTLTKAWVFSWPELSGGNVYWLWPGHAGFQLSWNQGALFGMGQGNVWLFATLSTLAGCAIPLWLFYWGAARDLWLTAALGSVMGGLLGNLYDRLGLPANFGLGMVANSVSQRMRCVIGFSGSGAMSCAGPTSTSPIRCS